MSETELRELMARLNQKRSAEDTTQTRVTRAALDTFRGAAGDWNMALVEVLEYLAFLVEKGEIRSPYASDQAGE